MPVSDDSVGQLRGVNWFVNRRANRVVVVLEREFVQLPSGLNERSMTNWPTGRIYANGGQGSKAMALAFSEHLKALARIRELGAQSLILEDLEEFVLECDRLRNLILCVREPSPPSQPSGDD